MTKRTGPGRPRKGRPELAPQAKKVCLFGTTTSELAEFIGVSERAVERWAKTHKTCCHATNAARDSEACVFSLRNVRSGQSQADANRAERNAARCGKGSANRRFGNDPHLPSLLPPSPFELRRTSRSFGKAGPSRLALKRYGASTSPQGGGENEACAGGDPTERFGNPGRLASYRPYAKQAEFHAQGAAKRERLLMAANRFGKTECGAAEMAMHLTGRYPAWWTGKRFERPVRAWAAGITNESTRDVVQAKLIGPPERSEMWGSGLIPHDCMGERFSSRSVANALDTVSVKHIKGGFSSLQFKSYERRREKWAGTALEVVWFDEEPPLDIYLEGLTRTNETGGIVFVTFTPLLGHTDVVKRFLEGTHADRALIGASIFDAEHFSDSERERIIASYPAHQRDARVKGAPVLGTGHVFPVAEEKITCAPFVIPVHFAQINGLDFGWDHPFGAVNCAWDRDADVFYVSKEYRERETTPLTHAAAVRPWGEWIPCAWPHDGLQHDKGSGEELARAYAAHGLQMLPERATFQDGTNGVEAGVLEMLERMLTGRFKVFSSCGAWLEEFRLYHREEGRIVKRNDDLISASRYAYMMRRFASVKPRRRYEPPPRGPQGWMT